MLSPNRPLFQPPLALYLPTCKYILPLKWGRKLFSYIDPLYEVKQTNAYVKDVVYICIYNLGKTFSTGCEGGRTRVGMYQGRYGKGHWER